DFFAVDFFAVAVLAPDARAVDFALFVAPEEAPLVAASWPLAGTVDVSSSVVAVFFAFFTAVVTEPSLPSADVVDVADLVTAPFSRRVVAADTRLRREVV